MAKNITTTEYFATAKNLPQVREVAVLNLDKIEDPDFIKAFIKAYNANRDKQVSKYGNYKAKASVTANGYLKICHVIKSLTEIKVGRRKIKLNIMFKMGGINLSGETKLIRDVLKALGFRWNHVTEEWYNSFAVMPKIPTIPESVKPVLEATQPSVKKTGKPKLAKARKLEGNEAKDAKAQFAEKAKAKKAKATAAKKAKATIRKTVKSA